MSAKQYTIKFTEAEIDHLRTLLQNNRREGSYYGDRKQYYDRTERIDRKLREHLYPRISSSLILSLISKQENPS